MKSSNSKIHLLLGISGGIAAYKIPSLVRLLIKQNMEVKVVITQNASDLVGIGALRTVSGNSVYTETVSVDYEMGHISLADWADLFLIAPATANSIAKITHGIADNLLTSLALSCDIPIIIAPAMNNRMWKNSATQENIATLKKRGLTVLPVGNGELACGDNAPGRMLSVESLAAFVRHYNLPKTFKNKKVLISSGPTQEAIDPVRVITNLSSGKMGSALASAAMMMGAEVTVVSGPASTSMPEGVEVIDVKSAKEMFNNLEKKFQDSDIVIMAAAVSDYHPVNQSTEKIKRKLADISIDLTPNPDILATLSKNKTKQFIAGFSLESDAGITEAKAKMNRKKCNMMIYNRVNDSLGTDDSEITILSESKEVQKYPPHSKHDNAEKILLAIADQMGL